MIYLQKYGISAKLAAKIYNHYGMRVYKVMEENPYELADNIEGSDFVPQMRLRHASESIQIPITGLKADCFIHCSRQ